MRVVHVVTAFPRSEADPITPWLVELVRRERSAGIDATVLAPSYRGGGAEEVAGVPVHRFRYAPAFWERLSHEETVPDRLRRRPAYGALVPGYLAAGMRAAWREGRSGADVFHVHWPMPHALLGTVGRRASAGRSGLVCSYYSVEVSWVRARLPWLRFFLRWTVRTADEVTAISSATARAVHAVSPRPVRVIPYAAALEDDGRPIERAAFSDDGPIRLLFVGRLVERKGVSDLIRALALLRARWPAQLTIVGEGEWELELQRVAAACGVSEDVTFTGRLTRSELEATYEAADIFVLPAVVDAKGDTEGLGVVLLEALRFERPAIGSAIGGIPDIIEPGRTGWLTPPGDPEALAETLESVARRPEEAREMARRGREIVRGRFSWDGVIGATIEVYERAVARRRERA
ncbi:MAG: glycosyltransferase family 4 protein [Gemmatimonadota bacterium]